MKKSLFATLVLLLAACGNSVEGNLLGSGPCNAQGCYIELGHGEDPEHYLFVPKDIDPDDTVFDEGWFSVEVEESEINGEKIGVVKKLKSKKEAKF